MTGWSLESWLYYFNIPLHGKQCKLENRTFRQIQDLPDSFGTKFSGKFKICLPVWHQREAETTLKVEKNIFLYGQMFRDTGQF